MRNFHTVFSPFSHLFVCVCYHRLNFGHAPLNHPEKPVTIGQYLKQLSRHRNFMWFVSMNLIQVSL